MALSQAGLFAITSFAPSLRTLLSSASLQLTVSQTVSHRPCCTQDLTYNISSRWSCPQGHHNLRRRDDCCLPQDKPGDADLCVLLPCRSPPFSSDRQFDHQGEPTRHSRPSRPNSRSAPSASTLPIRSRRPPRTSLSTPMPRLNSLKATSPASQYEPASLRTPRQSSSRSASSARRARSLLATVRPPACAPA